MLLQQVQSLLALAVAMEAVPIFLKQLLWELDPLASHSMTEELVPLHQVGLAPFC